MSDVPLSAFKATVREQFYLLLIDTEAALAAIPSMLPDDSDTRQKAFDLICQVLTARGESSAHDRERIERVGRLFHVDGQLRAPRNLDHRSRQSERTGERRKPMTKMKKTGAPMRAERDSDTASEKVAGMTANGFESKYDRLIAHAKQVAAARAIVVHPCDETSLRGAVEAAETGIIIPILVGPAAKINSVAREHNLDVGKFELVDVAHSDAAAAKAVELIRAGQGELLMKGSLHTDELMRAVTASSYRLADGTADKPRVHHGRADIL